MAFLTQNNTFFTDTKPPEDTFLMSSINRPPFMHLPGKEAIWFQFKSDLATNLTKAFSKAIEFVNSIDYTGIPEDKYQVHRRTLVYSYCKRNLFPEMMKIIKDTCNINVTDIKNVGGFSGHFAVDLSMDDEEGVRQLFDRGTGQASGEPAALSKSVRELAEISENLDLKNAKLKVDTFGNNRRVTCVLFMDVDMAFLSRDNFSEKLVEPLAADELSAIYCHEIGHVISMIEFFGHEYQVVSQMKTHLFNAKKQNNLDLEESVNVYKSALRPALMKKGEKKMVEICDHLCDAVDNYKRSTDSYFNAGIELIAVVLKGIFFTALFGLVRMAFTEWFNALMRGVFFVFNGDDPGMRGKSTDTSTSTNVYYHAERMADEFVARLGYAGALSSALNKLNAMFDFMYNNGIMGSKVDSERLRNSVIFMNYIKFMSGLCYFFRADVVSISKDVNVNTATYEDNIARLERLLTDTNTVFKKALPPAMADHYLNEIARIKNSLKETKKSLSARTSDWLWKYILDIPSVCSRLFQLDDVREFEEYHRKLDKLINNELYAQAAAFRQLLR